MNFIKNLVLALVLSVFFSGHQLLADDQGNTAQTTQTAMDNVPFAVNIINFLGKLSQAQDKDGLTLGMSCGSAKTLCELSGCCSWAKPIEKDSCSSLCPQAQSFCNNCPSKYKVACDLGCKYVNQCDELCPCLQAHCSK